MIRVGHVRINLSPLRAKVAEITMPGSKMRAAYNVWARLYSSFIRRRFVRMASGGSDEHGRWPRLKKPRAAQGKRKGKADIPLRDTDSLYNALVIGAAGNITRPLKNGILFGFGGPARHPGGGKASIADIAKYHDAGDGNLPVRQIIVPPDEPTVGQMAAVVNLVINR